MTDDSHPPRADPATLIRLDDSSLGDFSARDFAGGNIYNGVSPEHIVALMHEMIGDARQHRQLEQAERDIRRAEHDREQAAIRGEIGELRAQIGRVIADIAQYRDIGASTDRAQAALIDRRIRRLRAWLAVAVGGGVVLLIIVAWLLYRELLTAILVTLALAHALRSIL